VYNDHPRNPKFVAVVGRWSLFRGNFILWNLKLGLKNGGRYRQVVVVRRWSFAQVWLYDVNWSQKMPNTERKQKDLGSISSSFYARVFHTKVLCAALLYYILVDPLENMSLKKLSNHSKFFFETFATNFINFDIQFLFVRKFEVKVKLFFDTNIFSTIFFTLAMWVNMI